MSNGVYEMEQEAERACLLIAGIEGWGSAPGKEEIYKAGFRAGWTIASAPAPAKPGPLPPRVWVRMHLLPDEYHNEGEPWVNAQAWTDEEREYSRSKGYADVDSAQPYVPEQLLEQAKREARAEGKRDAFQEAFDFLMKEKVAGPKSPLAGWFRGMWEIYRDEAARKADAKGGGE